MWHLIRPQKLLLIFCGKDTSQSLEHQPSSWVTEGPTLRATSSASCVSSWAFGKRELHHTTPKLTDRWSKLIKHWCGWLENWVKIRRQTGLSIYWNWYMLTIPQDQPSQDTAHTIWCLGNDCTYPLTSIFPLSWAQKNTSVLIIMLLTYVSDCAKPSRKCKCSPYLRLKGRGNTLIVKLMPFHWNQATWSWLKLMPTKGGERWKTDGRSNHMKWNAELLKASLPTSWQTSKQDAHSTGIDFFLITPVMWASLCSGVCTDVDKVCHHCPGGAYLESEWEWGMPQSAKCLPLAQHQTGETSLGWINRKFCVFLRMFSGASLLDQGWKVWCRGKGVCGCQCWHSGGGGTDHTDEVWKIWLTTISSIPPLFILEIASSKHGRGMNGHASLHIDLWDDRSILNTDAKKTPGVSYVRDPYHYCSTPIG